MSFRLSQPSDWSLGWLWARDRGSEGRGQVTTLGAALGKSCWNLIVNHIHGPALGIGTFCSEKVKMGLYSLQTFMCGSHFILTIMIDVKYHFPHLFSRREQGGLGRSEVSVLHVGFEPRTCPLSVLIVSGSDLVLLRGLSLQVLSGGAPHRASCTCMPGLYLPPQIQGLWEAELVL